MKDKLKPTCSICQKKIEIPGEEYCILGQYTRENKFYKDAFYHVKCFVDRYLANTKVNQLMERTNKLFEKVEKLV